MPARRGPGHRSSRRTRRYRPFRGRRPELGALTFAHPWRSTGSSAPRSGSGSTPPPSDPASPEGARRLGREGVRHRSARLWSLRGPPRRRGLADRVGLAGRRWRFAPAGSRRRRHRRSWWPRSLHLHARCGFRPKDLHHGGQGGTDFIASRQNDRIGLVVFAGEAYTRCPRRSTTRSRFPARQVRTG